MQAPNVILSGGGMKGAYQYGFFKRIYEVHPTFEIKKVYAVSVGSLNAIPIISKQVDLLDNHWRHPTLMPFDTIAKDWDHVNSEHTYYRNIQRARAFIKKGSIYHSLNLDVCYNLIQSLSEDSFDQVKKKLIIISYDTNKNKLVFERSRNIDQCVQAIKNSSMFPGLFQIDSHIIDVHAYNCTNFNFSSIIKNNGEKWLCLDLQGNLKSSCLLSGKIGKNITIYSPELVNSPTLNTVSCLIVDRQILDDMIEEGQRDADHYLESFSF